MNIKDMSKEEATRRLAESIEKVNNLLADCRELSREHKLSFVYNYASDYDEELTEGYADIRWESSNC